MRELPIRKRMRLEGYDYSQNGIYFVTICVKDKHEILWNDNVGAIINRPSLSEYGVVVDKTINDISVHYPSVTVDKYVVMPNHIHMIIQFNNENDGRLIIAPTTSISKIVQQMKRCVSYQLGFSLWQKSFHDHIVRNEEEYQKIWQYIDTNPIKWEEDCYFK